ncbi:hypothetical protein [Actinomadura miaoliensis]
MLSLKVAAVAASAVGAVAVGGVTWASVSQPEADLRSGHSPVADAVQKAKDTAPAPVATPTCLPTGKAPKAPEPGKPAVGAPSVPAGPKAPEAPGAPSVPKAPNAPGVPAVPNADAPAVPKPATPELPDAGAAADGALAKAKAARPSTLPDCDRPSTAPKANSHTAPTGAPAAPKAPAVPAVPSFSCADLRPAVPVGGAVERAVMLPKGLKYASSTTGAKAHEAKKICTVTQKWVGKAGQWVTVKRIQTEAAMTESKLRQTLGLPAGGRKVTVGGLAAWQSPAGDGVLVVDPAGHSALLVNGSPVFATSLQDIAGKLHQAQ